MPEGSNVVGSVSSTTLKQLETSHIALFIKQSTPSVMTTWSFRQLHVFTSRTANLDKHVTHSADWKVDTTSEERQRIRAGGRISWKCNDRLSAPRRPEHRASVRTKQLSFWHGIYQMDYPLNTGKPKGFRLQDGSVHIKIAEMFPQATHKKARPGFVVIWMPRYRGNPLRLLDFDRGVEQRVGGIKPGWVCMTCSGQRLCSSQHNNRSQGQADSEGIGGNHGVPSELQFPPTYPPKS
jgi:hypothetical protein